MRPRPFTLVFGAALSVAGSSCGHRPQSLSPSRAPSSPPAAASPGDATAVKIRAALASPDRAAGDRARDVYRHPLETLEFFGLRDDMTVIELSPGAGWYTAVLAPVLKERGHLIAAGGAPDGPPDAPATQRAKDYRAFLDQHRAQFGEVRVVALSPPDALDLGAPGSADMVVTFRNLHNWIAEKYAVKMLAAAFNVLKPGGVLGIEDHRAGKGQKIETGYVPQGLAKHLAEHVGFKLVGASEINANAKDTKDYPEGVWTLPPSLRLGDKDRDKYLAIGESDRFTLKFVKPMTSLPPPPPPR